MGVFRKQHNAEGIPVQSGDRMKGAFLSGTLIVTDDPIGQGTCQTGTGRVDQHAGRLVHHQNVVIFIENGKCPILRWILRSRLIQIRGDDVANFHGEIRMAGDTVHKELFTPFQLIHQTGTEAQFLL